MNGLRRLVPSLKALGFAVVCSALTASSTLANLTGAALDITAVNEAGDSARLRIPVLYGGSPWEWSSTQTMEMRSPTTGDLIAILNPQGGESHVHYIDDPVVGLNFSVQSGATETTFNIASALLSFATMSAEGRASVGISVTDYDGDGAVFEGVGDPNGAEGAYLAQYNGFAGTVSGTTFAEEIPGMLAFAYSTEVRSVDVPVTAGFLPIGVPVSDMSSLFSFKLTANDFASGTSVFVIQVPPVSVEAETWGRIKSLYR